MSVATQMGTSWNILAWKAGGVGPFFRVSHTSSGALLKLCNKGTSQPHRPQQAGQYLGFVHWPQQSKEVVCRGITHEDEIIGGVLVVAGSIQGHHSLQERLRCLHGQSMVTQAWSHKHGQSMIKAWSQKRLNLHRNMNSHHTNHTDPIHNHEVAFPAYDEPQGNGNALRRCGFVRTFY